MNTVTSSFMALQDVQEQEYPGYQFKNITDLKMAYILSGDIATGAIIDNMVVNCPVYLPYVLPVGTYGATKGHCCAGIRYGTEPHEYISLPQLTKEG